MGELIREMKNDKKYYRRSIRLKRHDYSSLGGYFVTICAKNRRCLFGNIMNDKMVLNDAGMAVERCLRQIPEHYPDTIIDEHIVMPNHVHIIINIVGARHAVPLRNERFGKPTPGSLSTIVRSYKSAVTKQINELRNKHGLIVWQRNYYEHIIRNGKGHGMPCPYKGLYGKRGLWYNLTSKQGGLSWLIILLKI